MRHRILGLEAVLADGSVYTDLTRVVKNAAGYDLKHLFVGAEGTLGVITRIAVKLEPQPLTTATVLFGLASVDTALQSPSLVGPGLRHKPPSQPPDDAWRRGRRRLAVGARAHL